MRYYGPLKTTGSIGKKMKKNKPKIMLVPRLVLPVPAVDGGAIETLITSLIDENEIEQKAFFIVVSKFSKEAKNRKYKFTKIYYFKNDRLKGITGIPILLKKVFFKIWDKVLHNRITFKKFGLAPERDFLPEQILKIGRKEKVNFVSLEAYCKEKEMSCFSDFVGKDCICSHIHHARAENVDARKFIGNSISISRFVRDEWAKDKSISGYNEVLYNGIDIAMFSQNFSGEFKKSLREKLGFSEDEIIVVFVGRILEVKGITELLDAFDLIKDNRIKLLIIGDGPVGYGADYVDYVKERTGKMRNVKYIGYVPNNVLPRYYAISDIQIVPSICQEGAGLVAIEGMAQGLPLIITKSGGMPEYVSEKCSIQIPIDDNLSDNIKLSILELAEDKEKRKKMGEIGAKSAKRFDKKEYYNDFISIVEKHIEKENK